ncbi:AbrB/MazE/SpoVT family DNA-binding domain-containing protein [Mesorhizobium sp. CN5-321]|jgi:putative addiction module antidote|uniref:AbrB/MazE/SpoVT family DNA-binding domain-containing protein n=1 Tax=Mesorhizobium hunchu TaxID=3157708 RepID=UPI0032B77738
MNAVIRKIGNSEGIILPKELLAGLNLRAGDSVTLIREGDEVRLRRIEDTAEEFERKMKLARERMKKYETVYRALAK